MILCDYIPRLGLVFEKLKGTIFGLNCTITKHNLVLCMLVESDICESFCPNVVPTQNT